MNRKPLVSEARKEYEYHLIARGLAPNTIKTAVQVLNRWITINGDIRVDQIRGPQIDRFFAQGGWAPKTQNLYLSILKGGFFPFCRRMGYMPKDFDPTEGWRNVRTQASEKLWIPVEEFPALLDACDNTRDRAVLALGMYTFMRGGEIKTLRVQDIDLRNFTMTIQRWKTKEADVLPITMELAKELDAWMRDYKRKMGFTLRPEWFLVPARTCTVPIWDYDRRVVVSHSEESALKPTVPLGKPYDCVKRALRTLGYDDLGAGVHVLRRSGARALFDRLRNEGYDGALRRVASMLGHKETKTTEIYLGLSLEREQRNELLAGQYMFPQAKQATVVALKKEAAGGNRG